MVTVVVEHVDTDGDVLLGGELLACLGDALRGCQIDGGEVLNLFGRLSADDEVRRHVLRKRHRAERNCAGHGESHSHETKVHVALL